MTKCIICGHWFEDDKFDNDLCTPTCNDCAEFTRDEEEIVEGDE